MGNSYCNFTTCGPPAQAIVELLNSIHRSAYVTPTLNGRTLVFERESDRFSQEDIDAVGSTLSRNLNCPALAVAVFDDEELWIGLYEAGGRTVEYHSRGLNLGAAAMARAFGRVWLTPLVWALLQWPYVFLEHLRHAALAKLLGIPQWCVASGYRYIAGGEVPEGLTASELQKTTR